MKNQTSVIVDYCLSRNTDYAIMLNGKWGIGKTYYINEILIPLLAKTKNSTSEPLDPIYISLNGITNFNDIYSQIASSKIEMSDTKVGKASIGVLNSIANVFNVDLKSNFSIADFINFDNVVLIFDDLERISTTINIEDLLGFINTNFLERNRVKTILTANEGFITSDTKRNKNRRNKYYLIKEKFIGRTIDFVPDLKSIFEYLISNEVEDKVCTILKKHNEFIWTIVLNSGSENLRILKFTVSNLIKVLSAINLNKSEIDFDKLIFFTVSFSYEYKLNTEFVKLFNKEMIKFFSNLRNIDSKSLNKYSYNVGDYPKEFTNKYLSFENFQFFFYPSIFQYITSGNLNSSELTLDIEEIEKTVKTENETTPYSEYQKLKSFVSLNKKQFIPLCSSILWKIRYGHHTPYHYPIILSTILELSENGILNCSDEAIHLWFDKGFELSIKENDFSEKNYSEFSVTEIEFIDIKVVGLASKLKKWHHDKLLDISSKETKSFLSKLLKARTIDDLKEAISHSSNIHILKDIELTRLVETIIVLKNPILIKFLDFLDHIYNFKTKTYEKYNTKEDELIITEFLLLLEIELKIQRKIELEHLAINDYIIKVKTSLQ